MVQKYVFFLFFFSIYRDLVLPFPVEGYLMLLFLFFVKKKPSVVVGSNGTQEFFNELGNEFGFDDFWN
jgi:hypothetical protein